MTADRAPLSPAFNIAIAGIIVVNIPANSFATSIIGNHVYSFASLMLCDVRIQLIYDNMRSKMSRVKFCNST